MALPLSISTAIDRLALPFGVTVERRGGATVDGRGNAVHGPVTIIILRPVNIQPSSGRDLLRLVDGDRSKETIKIYAKVVLRTARAGSGQEADVLLFPEPTPTPAGTLFGRYTVKTAEDWQHAGAYTKAIAVKQEGDSP